MKNLKTLCFYEFKKLLHKKMVWITTFLFVAVMAATILSGLGGKCYVNDIEYCTHYELLMKDREHERNLTGRAVNQELLEEMKTAYLKYDSFLKDMGETTTDDERIKLTEAYMEIERPYKSIFELVRRSSGMQTDEVLDWKADEKDFYAQRMKNVEDSWDTFWLSDGEKAYWQQKEQELENPFIYRYKTGYSTLISAIYVISTFTMLLIGVCLSGIFADEHTLKTDQLLLSSEQGHHALYFAKILAGVSFSVSATVIVSVLAFLLSLGIYGADGFHAAIQLIRPTYSYPVSAGQFAIIIYLILIITAVTVSVGVMVLSELLHNSLATLAITIFAVIMGMFLNIPENFRVLSQLWDVLPMNLLFAGNIFDIRLIPVFGKYFTAWQAMPVIYLAVSILFVLLGKPIYRRYQCSGR